MVNLLNNEQKVNCNILGKKHVPKYLGLVFIDWNTGFCQEEFICQICHSKTLRSTMFNPESLPFMSYCPDAIVQKVIGGKICRRHRPGGKWTPI